MSLSRLHALQRELSEAYGRMEELEQHINYGANLVDGGPTALDQRELRRNGLFGFLSRRDEPQRRRTQSKRGSSKREVARYYVAFTDMCDGTRDFYVDANSKADALAKAKRQMREDGEKLQGAKWHVERDD